jgi:CBS domain-containing protein
MKASEVMNRRVIAATLTASARDIGRKLLESRISGMPVTDQDGRVMGVVSEEDILRALMEQKDLGTLTADNIMSKNLASVDSETSIEGVMQTLHDEGILRVPVIDSGKLVGIISRADIIRAALDVDFMNYPQEPAPAPMRGRTSRMTAGKPLKRRSPARS